MEENILVMNDEILEKGFVKAGKLILSPRPSYVNPMHRNRQASR